MCKNTNDVAHQSLAINQETRRRQNTFMAKRNHHVPTDGPEMEPVTAPNWEMPSIEDPMLQNIDLSLSLCLLRVVLPMLLLPPGLALGLLLLLLLPPGLVMVMRRKKMMLMARKTMRTPQLMGMSYIDKER
jgi:Flp pilus assembly protein TadB